MVLISDSCVMIDDAHMFTTPPKAYYRRSEWPTLPEIVRVARFTSSTVIAITEDVIFVGPSDLAGVLSAYAATSEGKRLAWE
jgi:hypothetical protein